MNWEGTLWNAVQFRPIFFATARAEVDLLDARSGLKPLSGFPLKACFEQMTLSTKVFGFGTLSH